jgi:hypothetical protein
MSFDKPASNENVTYRIFEIERASDGEGRASPGASPVLLFPLRRRPGVIEDEIDAPLGLMCC